MKIALIADAPTQASLESLCDVVHLTPLNYRYQLRFSRPDFLFVESAWEGRGKSWKYKIAAYPDHPQRSNATLRKLVLLARELGIPTVFWNREDGVHFERFIDSARLFEHIFTVDANCLPRYRAQVPQAKTVDTLMFAIAPSIHAYRGIGQRQPRACFVGSYSSHIHAARRARQEMLFAASAELGLTLYDRNSARKAAYHRYPAYPYARVLPSVPYAQTADIYREYLVSLNVNTVEDSPSMFSRRLVEIIGAGGLCVTTPALSVATHLAPYCHVVGEEAQARELLARLKEGYGPIDRTMIEEGAHHVHEQHTWVQRLQQVAAAIRG